MAEPVGYVSGEFQIAPTNLQACNLPQPCKLLCGYLGRRNNPRCAYSLVLTLLHLLVNVHATCQCTAQQMRSTLASQ